MILAGDVGGTKTNLALFERSGADLRRVRVERFESARHESFDDVLALFLGSAPPRLEAAGIGVAGPVVGGSVRVTNLPWHLEASRLASRLGTASVALVNDLEALAWAVPHLAPTDLYVLQGGESVDSGTIAVLAAGTGLGFSALVRARGATVTLASEGGHADFAPRGETQVELLRHLRARFGRVSSERVLSGPGLVNVYQFLRARPGAGEVAAIDAALAGADAPAVISGAGLSGRSALCRSAVELFISVYGAEAANWAVRTAATGGVFLGGGIAPRLFGAEAVFDTRQLFMRAFVEAGAMQPLLERMRVQVVLHPEAALLGAAYVALEAATP
jgi:glucokinase